MIKENHHTEFKSNFNDSVIETLVAFANTQGGKVIIGLDNNGLPVESFNVGRETVQKWVNQVKTKTQPAIIPDVSTNVQDGREVIELAIDEFPIKPVSFSRALF